MAVYLLRAGLNGPAKIGKADNATERTFNLQTAHYETLYLLKVWEGGRKEEAMLHARFKHFWIRGDWFTFCPEMLDGVGLTECNVNLEQGLPRHTLPVHDIVQVIDRLGGALAVAKVTGTTANTVYYWARRGSVPLKYFSVLVQHAQAVGNRNFDIDVLIRACAAKQQVFSRPKPVPEMQVPDLLSSISMLRIAPASDAPAPATQEQIST